MTKAPDRIWATLNDSPIGPILQGTFATEESEVAAQVEYIRADLVYEQIEEKDMHIAQSFSAGYDSGMMDSTIKALLERYRDETPLGHQPHMIADEVDKALGRI